MVNIVCHITPAIILNINDFLTDDVAVIFNQFEEGACKPHEENITMADVKCACFILRFNISIYWRRNVGF